MNLLFGYKSHPWTPATLRGGNRLALWIDAADSSTITLNGSNVSAWADKSGNGRNATQGTADNQPIYATSALNGLPSVSFDGNQDSLSVSPVLTVGNASAVSLSMFAVFKQSALVDAAKSVIWANSLGAASSQYTDYCLFSEKAVVVGDTYAIYRFGTGQSIDSVAWQRLANFQANTNPTLFSGIMDAATGTTGTKNSYINGNLEATGSYAVKAVDATYCGIGSRDGVANFFNGYVAEVILSRSALSTTDRQKLEGYLAWKWGLQDSLPTGHPYRYHRPMR